MTQGVVLEHLFEASEACVEVLLCRLGDHWLHEAHQPSGPTRHREVDLSTVSSRAELVDERRGNGPEVRSITWRLGA